MAIWIVVRKDVKVGKGIVVNKLIKLVASDKSEIYIYPKDVLLLHLSRWDDKEFYSVCVRGVNSWLSIDAESYFKLKAILDNVVKS